MILPSVSLLLAFGYSLGASSEQKLKDTLWLNYDQNLRPVHNPNTVTVVAVRPTLDSVDFSEDFTLVKLTSKAVTVTVRERFFLSWTDEYMMWTPNSANITRLKLPLLNLWRPRIHCVNAIRQSSAFNLAETFAEIQWSGQIETELARTITVSCVARAGTDDRTSDQLECPLVYRSSVYEGDELTIENEFGGAPSADELPSFVSVSHRIDEFTVPNTNLPTEGRTRRFSQLTTTLLVNGGRIEEAWSSREGKFLYLVAGVLCASVSIIGNLLSSGGGGSEIHKKASFGVLSAFVLLLLNTTRRTEHRSPPVDHILLVELAVSLAASAAAMLLVCLFGSAAAGALLCCRCRSLFGQYRRSVELQRYVSVDGDAGLAHQPSRLIGTPASSWDGGRKNLLTTMEFVKRIDDTSQLIHEVSVDLRKDVRSVAYELTHRRRRRRLLTAMGWPLSGLFLLLNLAYVTYYLSKEQFRL